MKYLYLGAGILALCLVLCLASTSALSRDAETAAASLEKARGAAEAGDFDAAARLTARAKEFWESRRGFFGMVLRHDEADQVQSTFCALLAYAENRCTEEFEPTCAELIEQIRHLSDMEAPRYYNILSCWRTDL